MKNKILKFIRKLCMAFIILYGLNLILSSVDVFIPINVITLTLTTLLGTPGIIGIVVTYFLI